MSERREILTSLEGEYRRYKALGEAAIEQLTEEQLAHVPSPDGNSVAKSLRGASWRNLSMPKRTAGE